MNKLFILFIFAMLISACAELEPKPFVQSSGHIKAEDAPVVSAAIPELVETVPVLPEPSEPEPLERYTVVVNEVPVKELLFALARDAKINVDIHPDIDGAVTINAVEQTLPQILNRMSNQIDMRYEFDGDNLVITRDAPFLRTYRIDYVNMSRDMTSTNTVATQIAATSGSGVAAGGAGGGAGGGGAGGAGGGNNSTTEVTSTSNNNFWQTLIANINAIISDEGQQATQITNSVMATPESGLLTVRATARQHKEIQKYIDVTIANAKRQVLIRVTIAEVTLNDTYQAGVNWSLLQSAAKAGFTIASSSFTGPPANTISSFVLSYVDPNESRDDRLTTTVQLLDEFGDTRVLSSPQLMVLNNQTAVLKVVENIVYFAVDAEVTPNPVATGAPIQAVDTTAQTVPVGIVMSVTPQISTSGEVSLNVRPTISRISSFVNDPNPLLADANVTNPVPQIEIREMESMLRLTDGQIGVLGGLMQDESQENDRGLPGIKDVEGIGALFKDRQIIENKTELVIFIQPYIINSPSIETELEEYKQYLDQTSYYDANSLETATP